MAKFYYHMTILLLFGSFMGGCVATDSGPKITVEPMSVSFNEMPVEAATILSAVAIQTLTPPLELSGRVRFAPGVDGISEVELAVNGFELTSCILYTFLEPVKNQPGKVTGELEYRDLFDRKARFLFVADYVRKGMELLINRLKVTRTYPSAPKIMLTVVPSDKMDKGKINSYHDLIEFLADQAVNPADFKKSRGIKNYTLFAMSEDWIPRGAEITIGISASQTGYSGYKKDSRQYGVDGWPVVTVSGKFDPTSQMDPLFAKIFYKNPSGSYRLIDVYQLSSF